MLRFNCCCDCWVFSDLCSGCIIVYFYLFLYIFLLSICEGILLFGKCGGFIVYRLSGLGYSFGWGYCYLWVSWLMLNL